MKHYITLDIDFEDYIKSVDFTVYADYGNHGIGAYEFWGANYRDDYYCWEVHGLEWDESKYTEEENKRIEEFTMNDKPIVDILDKID